jgi:bis(5'-nucleosyl)-tetraphosphatase (symmetrical)
MTTYAIGDVQGNFQALMQLLEKIRFNQHQDTLWFTGNLVNRGPDSLRVLRFVKDLGKQAIAVLGNEEVHLLGIGEGIISSDAHDTFDEILSASDRNALLSWLRQCPFVHNDLNYTLVHAGIPAEWSLSQAQTFAIEVESSLSMGGHKTFLENIFADDPTRWHAKHRGWKRLRFITNAFTRMRYSNDIGRLDFGAEGPLDTPPQGYIPWYQRNDRAMAKQNIIFGHGYGPNDICIPGIFPLHPGSAPNRSLRALKVCAEPETITVDCDYL